MPKTLINTCLKNVFNKHSYKFEGELDIRNDAEGRTKAFVFFPAGNVEYFPETSKILTLTDLDRDMETFLKDYNGSRVKISFTTAEPMTHDQGFMVLPTKSQIHMIEVV